MAFTIVKEVDVWGKKRVEMINLTVDAASGNVSTRLSRIDYASIDVVSANSLGVSFKVNLGSAATVINGLINVNGATSGDSFFIIAVGV